MIQATSWEQLQQPLKMDSASSASVSSGADGAVAISTPRGAEVHESARVALRTSLAHQRPPLPSKPAATNPGLWTWWSVRSERLVTTTLNSQSFWAKAGARLPLQERYSVALESGPGCFVARK